MFFFSFFLLLSLNFIQIFNFYRSLVDLNRAGNPLMEIVFEPDLKNGDEAACLIRELILILKTLGTCACKLQGMND